MSQTKIMSELDNLLRENEQRYYLDGVLNKARVIEDLRNYEPKLITLLSENKIVKKHFILEINGNKIIKVNDLIEIFEMDEYWDDSYTSYENKIGLTTNRKFLSETSDVVLGFPYKDTVMKASMSKEEREKKDLLPEEPFLNEKIAREEIDTLYDNKILINATEYDEKGSHAVNEFSEKDNLILKGNNLIALHLLKEKYAGKIKLIYIDPPYYFDESKPTDTFMYNSNFKLSTWLVFMKNRLEITRELLADDGAIFVSIGKDGQAYLKILMDEVFGKKNFVETFIWRNTDNANSLGNKSRSAIESIHAYEKIYQPEKKWVGKISNNDDAPLLNSSNGIGVLEFPEGSIEFRIPDGKYKAADMPKVQLLDDLIVEDGVNKNAIRMKGRFKWGQENLYNEVKNGTYFLIKSKSFSIRYQKNEGSIVAPEKYIDVNYLEKVIGVGTYEDSNSHLNNLGLDFKYSKPESLIAFILNAVTKEDDIVLDFFMGSATTQSVAHKMNRRYIGIEQMDYINTVSVPRLQKVIEGESGGISNAVDWQGGGSFIYAELMEKNTGYLKDILNADSTDRLREIFDLMIENADFDFRVDLEKVKENIWRLPLEEQQRRLVQIIDKNQLYYNYSEIDDENIHDLITDSDYKFNKSFYNNTGDKNE